MRHCPRCGQEYLDAIGVCADDGASLLPGSPRHARPARDVSRLTTLLTVADRFEADELTQDLLDEGFDVALVTNRLPTVGPLTTPGPALYSIVAPDREARHAAALLAEWRPAIEKSQSLAEAAAELEEAATEGTTSRT